MLQKKIKFTDLDGNEREETFLFHMTQAEIVKFEASMAGGLVKTIASYNETKDGDKIINLFERLIRLSYGVKSVDGREFVKGDEVFNKFFYTEAYSALFMELLLNPDMSAAFVTGIIPPTPPEETK